MSTHLLAAVDLFVLCCNKLLCCVIHLSIVKFSLVTSRFYARTRPRSCSDLYARRYPVPIGQRSGGFSVIAESRKFLFNSVSTHLPSVHNSVFTRDWSQTTWVTVGSKSTYLRDTTVQSLISYRVLEYIVQFRRWGTADGDATDVAGVQHVDVAVEGEEAIQALIYVSHDGTLRNWNRSKKISTCPMTLFTTGKCSLSIWVIWSRFLLRASQKQQNFHYLPTYVIPFSHNRYIPAWLF